MARKTTAAAQHLTDTFQVEPTTADQLATRWATNRAASLAENLDTRRYIAQDLLTNPDQEDLEGLRAWYRRGL